MTARRRSGKGRPAAAPGRTAARSASSRVEQLQRRSEDVDALEEERPLLGKEELEGAEVEEHLIGLDLAEVGIEREVERERRRQPELEIGADVAVERGAVERVGALV